jgi:threonine dehydratase
MTTPQESHPEILATLKGNFDALYLKREDLHPLGSHKGRSIPVMIECGIADGIHSFVISSSGNAALAAALYIRELNRNITAVRTAGATTNGYISLEILIGLKIAPNKRAKLEALKDEHIRVSAHERPLQVLFTKVQEPGIRGLRQSNDDIALDGYETLAEELFDIKDLRAVFIGTSSGTTAQALAQYFLKHAGKNGKAKKPVEVHIVQTTSCHPMVADTNSEEISIADAIVDHTALRKTKLLPLIEKTGGTGWIATNEMIRIAQELTQKHANVSISTNSALSVAGLMNAIYADHSWNGAVACIICGE